MLWQSWAKNLIVKETETDRDSEIERKILIVRAAETGMRETKIQRQ